MSASNSLLLDLSDEQRQVVELWLVKFEQEWDEEGLSPRMRELPAEPSLRRPLLIEMIKIDLERHWQRNRRPSVEDYLRDYPELGPADGVPTDLIQAEYEVRQQFDRTVDLDDYARRFPRQVEALRRLLAEAAGGSRGEAVPDPTLLTGGDQQSTLRQGGQGPAAPLREWFGRYRIVRVLGKGGMGTVYLAHDSQLDRQIALKVPSFSPQDDPTVLERFYREARAAATLDHPNLCQVYDVGLTEGTHYLTMAYIEGESLAQRLKKGPPLSQREAAGLVRKVGLAVGEAHERGVIHRDLKPSNIMLNRRGEPVVMDFGLARRVNQEDVRLTRSGSIVGTPAYMPPEQVAGDMNRIGPVSDVYSLGVILYELLTGRLPFEGGYGEVMARILIEEPRPPSALRPDVEPELEAICLKAMAKRLEDRYASMAEFVAALDHCLNPPPLPLEKPYSRRRWLVLAGVVAGLLLVAGGVIINVKAGDYGTVKIELPEGVAGITVEVDGDEIDIKGLDEPVRLKAGERQLQVRGKNFETFTQRIALKRGGKEVVQVSLVPRKAADGGAPPKAADGGAPPKATRYPNDAVEFGGSRYKVFPEVLTWHEAKKRCEEMGGRLAVVTGERENAFLTAEALRAKLNEAWLGATDEKAEGRWVWVDGTPLGYSNWGRGQPNNKNQEEHYLLLWAVQKGEWSDQPSRSTQHRPGFICQWAPEPPKKPADPSPPLVLPGKPSPAVQALIESLTDKDAKVRRTAAHGLRQLKDKAAVPALMRRVGDDVWGEEHPPVASYGDTSPYEDVAAGEKQGSKYAALQALRELDSDKATEALLGALKSKNKDIRWWACVELTSQKDRAIVEALGEVLDDESARVRRAAAHGLRQLKDKAAVPALMRRVSDDVWGEEHPPATSGWDTSPYEDVAEGKKQGSKYAALQALRELDPDKATEALVVGTKSKNAKVKAWALKQLTNQQDKK